MGRINPGVQGRTRSPAWHCARSFCEWSIQGVRHLAVGPSQCGEVRWRRRKRGRRHHRREGRDNRLLLPPPSQHEGPHCGDAALKAIGFSGRRRSEIQAHAPTNLGRREWRRVFSDSDCWLMRNRSRGAEPTLSFCSYLGRPAPVVHAVGRQSFPGPLHSVEIPVPPRKRRNRLSRERWPVMSVDRGDPLTVIPRATEKMTDG